MGAKHKTRKDCREFRNTKARWKYRVESTYEAGIVLTGTEVKSIRAGKVQINESFAQLGRNGISLCHAHIAEYAFGNFNNHNPYRPRKLLLKKREVEQLKKEVESGGKTIIPLRLYFKKALVKVEIALCSAKKLYDKREELKKETAIREVERAYKYSR